MLGETKIEFYLSRAALSLSGGAKSKLLSVSVGKIFKGMFAANGLRTETKNSRDPDANPVESNGAIMEIAALKQRVILFIKSYFSLFKD